MRNLEEFSAFLNFYLGSWQPTGVKANENDYELHAI
jgi:hypothetical protein